MTAAVHWSGVDDIDDALAADFDGSLSGLGMELGTNSFNMRYFTITFNAFNILFIIFGFCLK